ncbi:hypothetical protein [Streptomyces lavendofoliae]|uniref:hypothetical protein n=1 Tax=Streptomyces lavendofoliae TaxID=67314 RepID=UPI00300ED25B
MTHRPALFAAVPALGRAGSNIGAHWVQSDYWARVKDATDDNPVCFTTDDSDAEPTVHGNSDSSSSTSQHTVVSNDLNAPWLFPTQRPGRPLGTKQLSRRLRDCAVTCAKPAAFAEAARAFAASLLASSTWDLAV